MLIQERLYFLSVFSPKLILIFSKLYYGQHNSCIRTTYFYMKDSSQYHLSDIGCIKFSF